MVSSCGPDVCAHLFPLFLQTSLVLTGVWLRQDSYFANTRRQPLAGRCSLEQTACQGKSNRVLPEPSAPRWVEISCQLMQENKGARKELGGEMKVGARMKGGHTFGRLITGASAAKGAEQWPLCVYMRHIIWDKAVLASSPCSRSLVATPPAPLPLALSLSL